MIRSLVAWTILAPAVLLAQDPPASEQDSLTAGRSAYERGDFTAATASFEHALEHGDAPAGGLLRALGDCAFRLDDPARALWFYRRALLRRPSDPDLHHDARVAAARLGLDPPPRAAKSVSERLLARLSKTPSSLLLLAALGLEVLALRGLLRRPRRPRRGSVLMLGLGLACGLLSWQRGRLEAREFAQVLAPAVVLRADPSDAAGTLYRARAGELLQVLERSPYWAHVEHPVAGRGWVAWRGLGIVD